MTEWKTEKKEKKTELGEKHRLGRRGGERETIKFGEQTAEIKKGKERKRKKMEECTAYVYNT